MRWKSNKGCISSPYPIVTGKCGICLDNKVKNNMKLEPNRSVSKSKGFTLIELLVVIAIISILAAILFPVAGTVREQSRASDCLTKLHQLWISALYRRRSKCE